MSHVHVCLVSNQPIPNLTTILQFKPDRVILLSTEQMQEQTERLKKIISKNKIDIKVLNILPYDVNNVAEVCAKVIDGCSDCDVSLNITGGTKVSALGAYQEFYTRGKPIYYVNTDENKILQISPTEKQLTITASVPMIDYLMSYGFYVVDFVKDDSYIYKREELTKKLAQMALEKDYLLGEINRRLQGADEKPFPQDVTFEKKELQWLVGALDDAGIAKKKTESTVTIPDKSIAKYLRGLWFEEYVYLIAKALKKSLKQNMDVYLNVKGKWDMKDSGPKNELDVVISKGTRLYLISCKTSYPDRKEAGSDEGIGKEYIYEILALGDRALGLFGEKILVSARSVKDENIKKRVALTGIKLIDGKNMMTFKEQLRQWLSK